MLKNDHFKTVFTNLVSDNALDIEEREYILSCAQILLKQKIIEQYGKAAIDLSYYIILKYSIRYNDYQPLYDISINLGYYPISSHILDNSLLSGTLLDHIQSAIIESSFSLDDHTVTKNQLDVYNKYIYSKHEKECSIIAPTSYGKSQMMLRHVSESAHNHIAIIVPTRSLLAQTYADVRNLKTERKIIVHEGMYDNTKKFIAIMTQERALRLLDENKDLTFDSLYIDEAQNLLSKGDRAILLSRLISLSKKRNNNCSIFYFSPTICDSNNLIINSEQHINELRINQNMKALSIIEYDGKHVKQYCPDYKTEANVIRTDVDYLQFIIQTSSERNFVFLNSPNKIESFSKELYEHLDYVDDPELDEIVKNLSKNIHPGLKIIEYLKKGILYLHGYIPDEIKEYLEEKYRNIESIRFLIANTVILEGINLPITTIYILNTDQLQYSNLTNLVGRANRLNYVFKKKGNLSNLISTIYFVKSEYARSNGVMSNTISLLNKPKDLVMNPMLKNTTRKDVKTIRELEQIVLDEPSDEYNIIKQRLVALGICYEYNSFSDEICRTIINNIDDYKTNKTSEDIFDIIEQIFINNLNDNIKIDLLRLSNPKTKKYYHMYFEKRRLQPINVNILDDLRYYHKIKENGNPYLYVSSKFGELSLNSSDHKAYVDIRNKTDADLVNYSIIKQKMDSDFVSYRLDRLFKFLYEFKMIDENYYNYYVFGTKELEKIPFIQSGLSIKTIDFLKENNQLINLYIDSKGITHGNNHFASFIHNLDDYLCYSISRFIQLDD